MVRTRLYDVCMGLLPDTQNCGCACAGNAGNVFPVAAGKRSRHASRHVRYARAVMHAGIAKKQFPSKSAAGENVPGIPGACATCHFAYLVRGPWSEDDFMMSVCRVWNFTCQYHSNTETWLFIAFNMSADKELTLEASEAGPVGPVN